MTQYLMRHSKRPLSLALAIVMVLTLLAGPLSITASAADNYTLYVDPVNGNDSAARADEAVYETVSMAVQRAQDGDTIALQADVNFSSQVMFRGNTKNLTLTSDMSQAGAPFTMTRDASFDGFFVYLQAGCTLTISDVILDGGAVWEADGSNSGLTANASLLYCQDGKYVLKSGAVLRNNEVTAASATSTGALIYAYGAWGTACIEIDGGELYGGRAVKYGGAIYATSFAGSTDVNINLKSGSIHDNVIVPNGGLSGGGGIYGNHATVTMENGFDVYKNRADATVGENSFGGGIFLYNSEFELHGGEIRNNSAGTTGIGNGGGVALWGSAMTINGGDIYDNNASADGGGVFYNDYPSCPSVFTMLGGEIRGNAAGQYGGGACAYDREYSSTETNLLGGEIKGNTAAQAADAVFAQSVLRLSTDAVIDGGVYLYNCASAPTVVSLVDANPGSTNTYELLTAASDRADGRVLVEPGSFTFDGASYSVADAEPHAGLFTHTAKRVIPASASSVNGVPADTLVLESYHVTVQDDGNGTASADITAAGAGDTITLTATPDSGYKLKEWNVLSGGPLSIANNEFIMPADDVVIEAIFESGTASTYTLTYDENGGNASSGPNQETNISGQNGYTLDSTTIPTHPGDSGKNVVFIGWSANQDSKIYDLNNTAPAPITQINITNNTTVYAVWGYDTNANGTADVLEVKALITTASNGGNITTAASGKYLPDDVVSIVATPNTGYYFDEWTSNGGGSFANDADASTTFTVPAGPAATITISAGFKQFCMVSYIINGGVSGTGPASTSVPMQAGYVLDTTTIPTRTQHDGKEVVFIGWTVTQDTVIYTKNHPIPATVTAIDLTGSYASVYAVWGYDTTNSGTADVLESKSLTVNAGSGGSITGMKSGRYFPGESVPIAAAADGGYVFDKWTCSDSAAVFANVNDASTNLTMPTGDAVVTANFTSTGLPATYTLTYDVNGGNADGPAVETGISAQSGYGLDSTVPTHGQDNGNDVVFIGWSEERDGIIYGKNSAAPTNTITTVDITKNTAVYAVWGYDTNNNGIADVFEAKSLTISAGAGGEVTTGTSGKYLPGDVVAIDAKANAGYAFDSWTSNNGGTFANAADANTTFTMPSVDVTITANFTPVAGSFTLYVDPVNGTDSQPRGDGDIYKTLARAVSVAQSGDKIVLLDDVEVTGSISPNAKALTITSDTGKHYTVSRASGVTASIFTVYTNSDLTLSNITVDGGANWQSDGTNTGVTGGDKLLYCSAGRMTLDQGTIVRNSDTSTVGGLGRVTDGGILEINNAELYGASAPRSGGALYLENGAKLKLNQGSIYNNTVREGSSGDAMGGAIFARNAGTSITMENGFAIYNNHAAADGQVSGSNGAFGGAVYLQLGASFTMNGGDIHDNSAGDSGAGYGGALSMNGGTITIKGGDIHDNDAATGGGGIYLGGAASLYSGGSILNVAGGKIRDNTAESGGAIHSRNYNSSLFEVEVNLLGGEITGNMVSNSPAGEHSSAIYAFSMLRLSTDTVIDGSIHMVRKNSMYTPSDVVVTLIKGDVNSANTYLLSTEVTADGTVVVTPGSFVYDGTTYSVVNAESYVDLFTHMSKAIIPATDSGGLNTQPGTLGLGTKTTTIKFDMNIPAGVTASPNPTSYPSTTAEVGDSLWFKLPTNYPNPIPTLAGYQFQGWSLTKNGLAITPSERVEATSPSVITLYVVWSPVYTVTMQNDGNGTAAVTDRWGDPLAGAAQNEAADGEFLYLNATPNAGYSFKEWEIVSGNVSLSSPTGTDDFFVMPADNVTIKAIFKSDTTLTPDGGDLETDPYDPDSAGMLILRGKWANESTYTLDVDINGAPANSGDLTWSVEGASDYDFTDNCVSVDPSTGEITVQKSGIVRVKATSTANPGESFYVVVIVPGDYNRDGFVSTRDANEILSIELGAKNIDSRDYSFELGDLNKDGYISSRDANTIFSIELGAYEI